MPVGTPGWSGKASLGLGWGLFTGHAGDNRPHAHHAVQIVLSETTQALWIAGAEWQRCHGAILGPDVQHRLAENAAAVTLLYLEPDSAEGRQASAGLASGWRLLAEDVVQRALAALRDTTSDHPAAAILQPLGCPATAGGGLSRDALIESLIAGLPAQLPERISAQTLARQAGLSTSRLQHRFRAHTGLALRPYLRWRRLLTAMDAVSRGQPLTAAALDAGFADAAHCTRTFRRHFGITPSVLRQLQSRSAPP